MHKNIIWAIVGILILYLTFVVCDNTDNVDGNVNGESRAILESDRRIRRRHGFHHLWGWHALAIAYWVKVKLVIVSFFVGSAIFLGLRYFWPHKCAHEIAGPVILDHPPSFSHHDHIPYALDHSDHVEHSYPDVSSYEPYSAYVPPTSEGGPPSSSGRDFGNGRQKRSIPVAARQKRRPEEQIAEFMFTILGVDSSACRRRFICEMEFRSRENAITSMAFRIIGRGFFAKYINNKNIAGRANNFAECAVVNPDCVFIEQNFEDDNETQDQDLEVVGAVENDADTNGESTDNTENEIENNDKISSDEITNTNNINAERNYRNVRERGDRKIKTIIGQLFYPSN